MDYEKINKEALATARRLYNMRGDWTNLEIESIFPEFKESYDERIRKEIVSYLKTRKGYTEAIKDPWIAWLEKQGEPTEINPSEFDLCLNKLLKQFESMPKEELASSLSFYLNVVQNNGTYKEEKQGEQNFFINDKVVHKATGKIWTIHHYLKDTNSYYVEDNDGLLHHYRESELKLVEQKPAVEPKFKVGDWIVSNEHSNCGNSLMRIEKVGLTDYLCRYYNGQTTYCCEFIDKSYHFWTIKDAKDGDVLCCESGWTCIFKALNSDISFSSYCFMDDTGWFCETGSESHTLDKVFMKAYNGNIYPATKEQRDQLEKAMANAGYTFDFEKKELKKIEQTLTAWGEENEDILDGIIEDIEVLKEEESNKDVKAAYQRELNWLKSLKERCKWKPSGEQIEALDFAADCIVQAEFCFKRKILKELLEQLKKLREE